MGWMDARSQGSKIDRPSHPENPLTVLLSSPSRSSPPGHHCALWRGTAPSSWSPDPPPKPGIRLWAGTLCQRPSRLGSTGRRHDRQDLLQVLWAQRVSALLDRFDCMVYPSWNPGSWVHPSHMDIRFRRSYTFTFGSQWLIANHPDCLGCPFWSLGLWFPSIPQAHD